MAFGSASFVRTIGVIVLTMLFPSFFPQGALLLPFLSAALWTPPARDPGASEPQTPDLPLRHPVFPPRLALRAVIFFAISALFLSISLARRSPDMLLAEAWSDPLYTLGALAVGLFLVRFPGAELRRIYLGSEISLILGFMVFAALGEGDPKIPLVFLQFGAGIFGAYFITLFLYLGGRAGREQSLRIVATGQMVIMGAVVLGILLTKTIGAFAFRYGVPFVLATSLLGVGLLFLSRCFFGDDQETFAGYALADVTGIPEPEAPVFSGEETVSPRAIEAKLSRQEMRVALLVVKGFRNEDMSRELNVTGNTIRSHLKNIHRKMGSSNRKELQSILQGMAGTASSVMVLERRETGFADSVPEGSIPELRFPKYLEDPSRLSGERENQPPDTPSMGSRKARG